MKLPEDVQTTIRTLVQAGEIDAAVNVLTKHTAAEKPPAKPIRGKLLSVRETAKRLGVGRGTIFEMLRDGRLPRRKLGARTTRIPEDAVIALAEGQ